MPSASETFFDGFLDDYFAECEEHLVGATGALLALEAAVGTPDAERPAIGDLFRFYHSLKGISAMVELKPAERLAHHLEEYLRALRSGDVPLGPSGIDALIDGTQRLEAVIAAHRLHGAQPAIEDMVARLSGLSSLPRPESSVPGASETARISARATRRWRCTFTPTRELMARGIGVDAVRRRLSEIGTIVDATPHVQADGTILFQFTVSADADSFDSLRADSVIVEALDLVAGEIAAPTGSGPRPTSNEASAGSAHVVRVDLGRLDDLMRNIGDLVICRARLDDSLSRVERHVPAVEWRAVQEHAVAIDRQLRTLREGLMRVRLVPVGEIFRRMPFVVRDLARESGKRVVLDLQGQATEIDKYLIERMLDPVLHLVRNAVSHGIELPVERIAAGKRPEGTITLSASTVGETVTIEIADDGRGVDAEAVAARAQATGIPVPPGALTPETLLSLLCAPGFSTRDEADRVSGRGVGMAVVKSTIGQLSGSLALATEPGAGTRFTIQLPLTLAIADALIARVGSETFAVPQSAVREVVAVAARDVQPMEQNEIISHRGGALPIVRVSRLFGIEEEAREHFHLFIIGTGAAAVGLAVDRIVGQREIVVRAIEDPLVRVEGISGATDLGDGHVVLILDPAALVALIRARTSRSFGNASQWGRIRA